MQLKLDRNIQIFRDYLETVSPVKIGKKHHLNSHQVLNIVIAYRRNIIRMISNESLPEPTSYMLREMKDEKEYWLEMFEKYIRSIT